MAETDQRGQQENQSSRGYGSMDDQRQNTSEMNNESGNSRNENGNGNQGQRSSNRGFAAMSPERQKEIASEGGRAAHQQGVAHEWTSEEARQAGKKGGMSVSQNREHMSEIGRRGGQSSGGRRKSNKVNGGGMTE
jgi:general stress protein YciG